MEPSTSAGRPERRSLRQFGLLALCLFLLLSFFFRKAYLPDYTVFSNDGPLGAISSQNAKLPANLFGCWQDLNWLGGAGPSALPNLSVGLNLLAGGALGFSKIYAPFAAFFLGLSVWFCFRQWRFSPLTCFLGGLAGTLNGDFLSTGCWGVAGQPICFGLNFLALGAAAPRTGLVRWLRLVLAGFAIGLGVTEAFDIGAIFSLFTGAFILFQEIATEGATASRITKGVVHLGVVSVCAAFIAAAALSTLIGTQIKGVAGMEQDQASKEARWEQATQWSLPKTETLSIIIPGLFGYRMDTPEGGNYWGAIGRAAAWDRYLETKQGPAPDPNYFFPRYSGGGVYSGVLVFLIAFWALVQSLRREGSPFSPTQKRLIWFWAISGFIGLLLAFGKYAPFYRIFYALPYASTIRNPAKFVHVVNFAIVIIFGFGVDALSRRFFDSPATVLRGLPDQIKAWWSKAHLFDKRLMKVLLCAFVVSLLGWFMYNRSRPDLIAHLADTGIGAEEAGAIASFSSAAVGKFVLFFAVALGLLAAVLSGYFSGARARTGGLLLGLIVCADLVWADLPWPITYNWKEKYESNAVIDFLDKDPYEHRVSIVPFNLGLLNSLYGGDWKQHLFQYYNIQCLDDVQRPRPSVEFIAFETALHPDVANNRPANMYKLARHWELTNTRYLLGITNLVENLNSELDPQKRRFRVAQTFSIAPKPGVTSPTRAEELTANVDPHGQIALIEFTGAMPRASLYSNWQVSTNDQETLKKVSAPDFDSKATVFVAEQIPASAGTSTNNVGTVEYQSYAPKDIVLKASASAPAVLLLNDKHDENWKVFVDGKQEPLLRCNYVMRGVQIPAGEHRVEFHFRPPATALHVSLVAIALGLAVLGVVIVESRKPEAD